MEEIKEQERNHEDDRNKHTEDRDILQIVNSIEGRRQKAEGSLRVPGELPCTIYQVPKVLRQVNEKCYEPQLVSIGPYHHRKNELKPMEEKKFQYLLSLLSRNPGLKLENFVMEIKELEAKARKCYSESIILQSKEFVEMMVLDGGFLVELLLRNPTTKNHDELRLSFFITRDMLLLENQLPFFVLERIFSLVEPNEGASLMKDRLLYCFQSVLPLNKDAATKESYHHVLDMFHHHCLPTHYADMDVKARPDPDPNAVLLEADTDIEAQHDAKRGRLFTIPSAGELQDAGIKFKRKKETRGNSFNIEFRQKDGIVEIPQLYFSDDLHFIFRNLIAYEQCNPKVGTFVTSYALFMDDLIDAAKDVRILRHAGILEHGLGSDEELGQLFNQLSRGIFHHTKDTYLYRERMDINEFCGKPTNRWRAVLVREYFGRPWSILHLIYATLGLYLAILQTAIAVKSAFY